MKRVYVLITILLLLLLLTACMTEPKINLEYNVYNDDGSVKIDVYINDTLMDVKVFADDYEVVGPYNFKNYTLADPIMNFLDINYIISKTNDSILLSSKKYGDMEFTYVGSGYRDDSTMIDGSIYMVDEQLYLPFWVFRVYTNGSLKQEDSSSMYLYTGDYERTDLPETLEECYDMLNETLSPKEIRYMKRATERELALQHMGLGMWIRNNWLYPTQSKLPAFFNEYGIKDFDNMSSLILVGYHEYLNGQPCSVEDLLNSK